MYNKILLSDFLYVADFSSDDLFLVYFDDPDNVDTCDLSDLYKYKNCEIESFSVSLEPQFCFVFCLR